MITDKDLTWDRDLTNNVTPEDTLVAEEPERTAPLPSDGVPFDGAVRPTPAAASRLAAALVTFRRWLHLADPAPVHVVAAALAANRADGDPVWVLLVSAPSTGKTEILSATTGLPYVVSAAKVTEASLLSGTSRKEKAANATGGLLRQIGAFGVLVCKDFTSVLAQNWDARAEAMAALREVYDGAWDRPVGTDGGKVLAWRGKCGLLGGVTPALDQYGAVLSALGDRFVLLRLPDADVARCGRAALAHGEHERAMRRELADAMRALVEGADHARVNRTLTDEEQQSLIALAAYTARARTAVVRDGYSREITYLPQVEGPGRLVKAYARLLGGLEAIGCDTPTAWTTLTRIATDSVPALRTRVVRALVAHAEPLRTSAVASAIQTVTKTASAQLEDLAMLGLAERSKAGAAANAPDLWRASDWLRTHWPSPAPLEPEPPDGFARETLPRVAKDLESPEVAPAPKSAYENYPSSCQHKGTSPEATPRDGDDGVHGGVGFVRTLAPAPEPTEGTS